MRMRTLKPGFFKNEELAELQPLARLLFAGLWCMADREGRLEDRPKRIKAELLPYDSSDVAKLLDALASSGFIVRYSVDGHKYIAIPTFRRHQNPHMREPASTMPAPCEHSASTMPAGQSLGCGIQSLDNTHPPSGRCEREEPEKSKAHPEAAPLCEYLGRALAHWKPDARCVTTSSYVSAQSQRDMDLLLRVDGRDPARAREIIDWVFLGEKWSYAPTNGFDWRPNLQSGGALRKHWDRLDNQCRLALTDEKDRT